MARRLIGDTLNVSRQRPLNIMNIKSTCGLGCEVVECAGWFVLFVCVFLKTRKTY